MIAPGLKTNSGTSADAAFAELVEELTAKLQAREPLDVEAYLARYPEQADRLRPLLPALQLLGALSEAASGGLSFPPSERDQPLNAGMLGDFRIVREVGRGGMGVVYEAEQITLRRRVALKVLPFAATMDARQLQRFQNEARAAAGLHHTNIVPVYFVGNERGVHYYAMQFIDGQDLASVIAELREQMGRKVPDSRHQQTVDAADGAAIALAPPPAYSRSLADLSTERTTRSLPYIRRVTRLGIQAAEALDHAHQQGIVHRDVKPANLLVDAEGRLWVMDFGLAQIQTDTRLTMTGDLIGTLRYMSPEQALAKRVVVDHRTDIYSLGATLYELLTLEPVFDGCDRQELLRQIAFEEPRRARRWNRAIPRELETIVLKAMDRNPADRYATAQELADDLRNFLEDRPILARRPSLGQILVKWSHRHRGLVASAFGMLFLVALVLGAAAAFIWQANRDTKEAKKLANFRQREFNDRLPAELARSNQAEVTVRESVKTMEELLLAVDELEAHDPPTAKQVREKAEGKALAFYGTVLQEHYISEEKSPLLAWAYVRLGNACVRHQEFASANQWYGQAAVAFDKIVRDAKIRQQTVPLMENPEVERGFREALALWKKTAPDEFVPDYRINTYRYHRSGVEFWVKKGDLAEARHEYTRALTLLDNLAADHSGLLVVRGEWKLQLHMTYGDCLLRAGHSTEARQIYLEAFSLYQETLPLIDWRVEQYHALAHSIAQQLQKVNCLDEAEETYRLLLVQYRKKLASGNINSEPWLDIAVCQCNLADLLLSRGQRTEAENLTREFLGVLDKARQPHPFQRSEYLVLAARAKGHIVLAKILIETQRFEQAQQECRLALEYCENGLDTRDWPTLKMGVDNDLAWLLATCPNTEIRDVKRAVELAAHAVQDGRNDGACWTTLGVAHYRNGDWKSAIETLTRAVELGKGGTSYDFFFLAMAHWQLCDKEQARQYCAKAVDWMKKNRPNDDELRSFRDEARTLLEIKDLPPADEKKAPTPKP